MNIFWLDLDLQKCTEYYVNKHVVKMITEYAQLLSASSRLSGLNQGYKLSHAKHPCTLWLLQSAENWELLYELSFYLHKEYQHRYGFHKEHSAFKTIESLTLPRLPRKPLTKPPLCMPDYCKCDNVIQAYRNYYIKEKRHIANWGVRPIPYWWV